MNYIQRLNHSVIEASIERPYVTAILGPRRVGKSSFVQHYTKEHEHRNWVFLNMDYLDQRQRVQNQELTNMIEEHAKQRIGVGNKIWVVIDKAQKCPELFEQIKILYDAYKDQEKIKFVLTGSALLSLHKLSAESLAGRIELNYLYEFTLRESGLFYESSIPTDSIFNLINNGLEVDELSEFVKSLAPFKPILNQQLSHLLLWGGFPELLSIDNLDEKIIYLKNYLQTYLEKDVRAIESITDLNLYQNMMTVLAEQTASIRDDNKIIQALGCGRDTLKKYRGYLEATLLYQSVYPHISNSLKRLVKSPKGYFLDNGLVGTLTGLFDLNILCSTGLIGHRLENWLLNEINTWIARIPYKCSIEYWRTTSGVEVDFVMVKKPHVFPFEVTYSTKPDIKKFHNLKIFLQEEPQANWGYYIYQGQFEIDYKNKIIFLPCWAIA